MHGNKLTWGCRKRTDISEHVHRTVRHCMGCFALKRRQDGFGRSYHTVRQPSLNQPMGASGLSVVGFGVIRSRSVQQILERRLLSLTAKRLELSNGHKFLWHWIELVNVPGYWSAVGEFTDEQGGCLLHCDAEVTIEPAARLIPELSLMVLLGDYLRYQGLLALKELNLTKEQLLKEVMGMNDDRACTLHKK